jgi:hypothetical protein
MLIEPSNSLTPTTPATMGITTTFQTQYQITITKHKEELSKTEEEEHMDTPLLMDILLIINIIVCTLVNHLKNIALLVAIMSVHIRDKAAL